MDIVESVDTLRFSQHALSTMKLRGITRGEVHRALAGHRRIDGKSGHIVSRLGNLVVVAQEDGATVTVLTAMHAEEFPVAS